MSFKSFSSAQNAPAKANPAAKSTGAPAAGKPPVQPDKAPAKAAPAAKS